MAASTGRARSNAAGVAAHHDRERAVARAFDAAAHRGSRGTRRRAAASRRAASRAVSALTVEQSMTIEPGRRPGSDARRRPRARRRRPRRRARRRRSARRARRACAARRSRVRRRAPRRASAVRFQTPRSRPARCRLRAMPRAHGAEPDEAGGERHVTGRCRTRPSTFLALARAASISSLVEVATLAVRALPRRGGDVHDGLVALARVGAALGLVLGASGPRPWTRRSAAAADLVVAASSAAYCFIAPS